MSKTEIPEPIDSFFAAVNNHDNQAFLEAFTDDGVIDDWGQIITGRENIDQWSDKAFIGSEPRFIAERATSTNGTITVTGDWRSTHANGPSRFDFELAHGKITSMTISEG